VPGQLEPSSFPPAVRALELPVGVVSVSATDPLLAPILTAASTIGSPVTNNLGSTVLTIGKTSVTWTETTSGATLTKYIYLYPAGWQVLGWTGNLRVFEHNGCRHILYDTYGRVHVIYNDAVDVWYRLGVRSGRRVDWQAPVQVNDAATPIGISSSNGTRGQTFGMIYDASGNVILQCTWSSSKPVTRSVWTPPADGQHRRGGDSRHAGEHRSDRQFPVHRGRLDRPVPSGRREVLRHAVCQLGQRRGTGSTT
jgi:hypothetical protein